MKLTNSLDANSNRITNLPNAASAQDPVTLAQLNAAVQGWSWKTPVRAATTANITLSGAQTIDTVSIIAGDRVLVKDQTTQSANGIYVAASGSWTRASDMDTSAECLLATCLVSEGTQGNSGWTMTTDGPITLDTTSLVWTQTSGVGAYSAGDGISIAGSVISVDSAVVARKASATIGDGSATTIAVTHSLGTKDVIVSVREVSTDAAVLVDWVANSTSQVQLTFSTAPTSGQYRVTVIA